MSERAIVIVVAVVQFVNILDFMIVMPLGPDFADDLGVPLSQLGLIGGSYTAAAAVAGVLGSFFLDRFGRRRALTVALLGLMAGTALGAAATGLYSLVAARIVAGMFGGPATALSLSIVADTVPPERRGKAMGTVMSAFSLASVLGVPAGLELSRLGGWRFTFIAVAILAVSAALLARMLLPPLREHLASDRRPGAGPLQTLRRPTALLALSMGAAIFTGMFMLIPNIAAYVQGNLGHPRAELGLLYLAGGVLNYFAMRIAGPVVDRAGAAVVGVVSSVAVLSVLYVGFVNVPAGLSAYFIFVGLMGTAAFRAVSYNTLSSRVPRPHERASYMSAQSAVQHGASAIGAFVSAQLLTELPGGALAGMELLGTMAIVLTILALPLFFVVQTRVKNQERRSNTASTESADQLIDSSAPGIARS